MRKRRFRAFLILCPLVVLFLFQTVPVGAVLSEKNFREQAIWEEETAKIGTNITLHQVIYGTDTTTWRYKLKTDCPHWDYEDRYVSDHPLFSDMEHAAVETEATEGRVRLGDRLLSTGQHFEVPSLGLLSNRETKEEWKDRLFTEGYQALLETNTASKKNSLAGIAMMAFVLVGLVLCLIRRFGGKKKPKKAGKDHGDRKQVTTYLIDFENTPKDIINQLSLSKSDQIFLFYSEFTHGPEWVLEHFPNVPYIQFIHCVTGKNAMDFQITAMAGWLGAKQKGRTRFVIVSGDTGYDAAIRLLQEKGVSITRKPVVSQPSLSKKKDYNEVIEQALLGDGWPPELVLNMVGTLKKEKNRMQINQKLQKVVKGKDMKRAYHCVVSALTKQGFSLS